MHSTLLAFDIGTSGLKASLVDENLNIIRNVTTSYPTHHCPDGGCEQDAADWWMSAVRAMMMLRELAPEYVKRSTPSAFPAICSAACPWTSDGQTLRPAMIHADTRALSHVQRAARQIWPRLFLRDLRQRPFARIHALQDALAEGERAGALRPNIPHPAVEGLSCLPPHGPYGHDRYVRRLPRAAHESGNARSTTRRCSVTSGSTWTNSRRSTPAARSPAG